MSKNIDKIKLTYGGGLDCNSNQWIDIPPGDSAYDIAVNNGFIGTEQEWLESLNARDEVIQELTDYINEKNDQLDIVIFNAEEATSQVNQAVSDANAASSSANTATELANTATENAIEATILANTATTNAQTATGSANAAATEAHSKALEAGEAALLANNRAGLAEEKASIAQTAANNANQAASNAAGAASNATTAAQEANTAKQNAETATENANEAASNANDTANHPTYIGEDHFVYEWDKVNQVYVKTEIYTKGDIGDTIKNTYDDSDLKIFLSPVANIPPEYDQQTGIIYIGYE